MKVMVFVVIVFLVVLGETQYRVHGSTHLSLRQEYCCHGRWLHTGPPEWFRSDALEYKCEIEPVDPCCLFAHTPRTVNSIATVVKVKVAEMTEEMDIETAKAARSSKRSGLNLRLRNINRQVLSTEDPDKVRTKFDEAKLAFQEFEDAHTKYHDTLSESADIEDSDLYYNEVEDNFSKTLCKVMQYLKLSEVTSSDKPAKSSTPTFITKLPPTPEPDKFYGKPENYPMWKASFIALIDKHNIACDEKMYYLKKYTGGDAQAAIQSLFMCPDKQSYASALRILDERFGNAASVASAFRRQLESWPKIGNDGKSLQKFADYLEQICVAKKTYPSLNILSDEFENRKLVKKLPSWLAVKWIEKVVHSGDIFPNFDIFTQFLSDKAKIANHTLWDSHNTARSGEGSSKSPSSSSKSPSSSSKSPSSSSNLSDTALNSRSHGYQSPVCVICQADPSHRITECPVFANMSLDERKQAIMAHRLCFGCLNAGHHNRDCKSKLTCAVCKRPHSTLLHDYNRAQNHGGTQSHVDDSQAQSHFIVPIDQPAGVSQMSVTQSATCMGSDHDRATTMVVPVIVSHPSMSSKSIVVYALLDTQSNTHFVSQDVLESLGIEGNETLLDLTTMNGRKQMSTQVVENLKITSVDLQCEFVLSRTYSRGNIPCNRTCIPTVETLRRHPHLDKLKLPPYYPDAPVGLLIGYTCPQALRPLDIVPGDGDEPFGVKTQLGWCVVGVTSTHGDEPVAHVTDAYVQGCISLRTACKEVLVQGPEVFELDSDEKISVEDRKFLDILDSEMIQRDDGYYEAPLPLKCDVQVPNNKVEAEKRLNGLAKKFQRDRSYQAKYVAAMNETLELGFAERVPDDDPGPDKRTWYIPHHGVSNKEKLRVVYDCSAGFKGFSLNEVLLQGPDLLNAMLGILLRFRTEKIGVSCDVQKMYHQFKVKASDKDLLRFLWWPNGDINEHPVEYRMTVHLFGATSSSGVAAYGLRKIARDHGNKYPLQAAEFVQNDFYVDDGVTSDTGDQEAYRLLTGTQNLLSEGGLHLHKIMSNSSVLMQLIKEEDRAPVASADRHKTLGVQWEVTSDNLYLPLDVPTTKFTHRGVLSAVSAIFDPMGFAAPLLLQAKVLLQQISRDNVLSWDDPLSPELHAKYEKWCDKLKLLSEIKVPRCHKPDSEFTEIELHHFADASTTGYAACSYIRYIDGASVRRVSFLLGKCKVVPIKPVLTVPRLELMAAVLAVQLAKVLRRELPFSAREFFWTDSTITLCYIKNDTARFKVFVANKVQKIRSGSSPERWFHISGIDNPADDGSRAMYTERWLNGPEFLHQELVEPPEPDIQFDNQDAEIKCLVTDMEEETPSKVKIHTYRDWFTTKKVWGWILRFIENCRGNKESGDLQVKELMRTEQFLLRMVQSDVFSQERKKLKSKKSVTRSSTLYKLDVFIDSDGLLRVGGRLKNAAISYDVKHPVVLPASHIVSRLILDHCHKEIHHQGRGLTVAQVRNSGYWILRLSRQVKALIRSCVTCRKLRGRPCEQKMADLPADRVTVSSPFQFTGCDIFGPFVVKCGRKELKRYGVIFTCLNSRAVHLEVVYSLSSDSFVNAFRRFTALRGPVEILRCDQGTHFTGAQRDLLKIGCDIKFNPPASSHRGGVWERMIGVGRRVIEGLLMELGSQLNDEGLLTVMSETAAVINSRPLNVMDLEDPHMTPLTPNHLLTMKSSVIKKPSPLLQTDRSDLYALKQWKRVQYMIDLFWTRWRKEILHVNQSRAKWNTVRRNLRVGDIVLIIDEHLHRSHWRLARITCANASDDGLVRSVTVKLAEGSALSRPVQKLILITESPD